MSYELLITLIAALTGGNLLLFIKFLIERHDKKKAASVDDRLDKLERDGLRLQLLFLIILMPKEKAEILKIAEYYFVKLKGNWYATSIFNKWLEDNKIAKPEWFDK